MTERDLPLITFLGRCFKCSGVARTVRLLHGWDTQCLECEANELKTDWMEVKDSLGGFMTIEELDEKLRALETKVADLGRELHLAWTKIETLDIQVKSLGAVPVKAAESI